MSWLSKSLLANRWRGDVIGHINGQSQLLRLSLDALARLENAVPDDNIIAFLQRISTSGMRADDALWIIRAGLYGAKESLRGGDDAAEDAIEVRGGYHAAVRLATDLLVAAFQPNVKKTN